MLHGARVAFHPELPTVVARDSFVYAGKRYARGAAFPWRDLGVTEQDALELWRMQDIDCTDAVPGVVLVKVTPGEHVSIETPQQPAPRPKHKRRW